ncbi:MAG: hypothetical protein LBL13_11710 [Bacteroidales bacterium]|jgi:hypothetical protein|nr:hypothetical protein [Bacteroidales bacterium]
MAYNDFLPIENEHNELEKELLDIFEVNSYSKNIFAAYKARILTNKICKEKYGKGNYKEYAEMLMLKHFPNEHKKARLGARYLYGLCFSVLFAIIFIMCFYSRNFKLFGLFGILIPALLIWKFVFPAYKQLKELYQ